MASSSQSSTEHKAAGDGATYDVIVIGAGPGGYVAAIRAAQLGLRTAVIERAHLGGICLNWGCIPTKALLRSAGILHDVREAEAFGIVIDAKPRIDIAAMVERSRQVSRELNTGVGFLLKKNGVDVIWGSAKLLGSGRIEVSPPSATGRPETPPPKDVLGAGTYKARNIIIATGARPRALPGLEPDGDRIWSYFEAMLPREVPRSLLIAGSGAIGIEFASFYRALGCEVTVVEVLDQILPAEDAEIAALARKAFEKAGIRIITGAKVAAVAKGKDAITATIEHGDGKREAITADRLISAVGVVGNVEGLGLEALGVKLERGHIVTDALSRADVKGIYAIGDVAGAPMLAHKAEHEGVICVEAIAGLKVEPLDRTRVPGCTYSHPQIASVGMTEAKAQASGRKLKIGRFPFRANGKALAMGAREGLVKTIFDAETGELIGAHMVGDEVTELIQGFVIAMQLEATEEDLMRTVFPHPTLSEMMGESVLDAYGHALHLPPSRPASGRPAPEK
ncbi:Dihydrolipoamide dehydrogenase of pyruvate dehydrogenase complex [Hyphomicrobium sulfonivorans]|uniref:Dihydrolipoyl dehydrogenase n=1 Tax=Hyphomicrobium sulfonivorans TaxID=121290 RepID=A0A109BCG8_HYPSL|nr:dihydrolipoyl dehydrogenase [Hyphomicrobium sulfonivorans]KWT66035.1 Dihydrolipoamide dehydrogenase of pyruvate dehydrogenase complex [Hyphomicrobium sulfonivorans]